MLYDDRLSEREEADRRQKDADARHRLNEAAPELLAAAYELMETCEPCRSCDGTGLEPDGTQRNACHMYGGQGETVSCGHISDFRAAIRKATGEAS